MLQVLRDVGEYDTIFFVPHEEEDDQVHVNVAKYKEHSEKIGGSSMGDLFDIIIFRMNEEDEITDLDRFEGILVDPRVYVSRMIKEDWFGMVTRKTTTSDKLADDVFASWQEM
jgi:hypothetical protein